MSLVYHLGDQGQVISTETGRILPLVTILVESADRDVVAGSLLGFVFPDGRLDTSDTNLVNWLLCHDWHSFLSMLELEKQER